MAKIVFDQTQAATEAAQTVNSEKNWAEQAQQTASNWMSLPEIDSFDLISAILVIYVSLSIISLCFWITKTAQYKRREAVKAKFNKDD